MRTPQKNANAIVNLNCFLLTSEETSACSRITIAMATIVLTVMIFGPKTNKTVAA